VEREDIMVKLTVLYNLPEGADHEEFIRWRTTVHQQENMEIPGVLKSDFYVIQDAWKKEVPPYRYMTEVYWPDMKSFRDAFFDPDYQRELKKSLERISDPLFLISEELLSESKT
jgi:uncharacterized protein YeaO (DUF488 family)